MNLNELRSLFGKYKFNVVNNTEVSVDLGVKTEQFNSKQPITRFQNLSPHYYSKETI